MVVAKLLRPFRSYLIFQTFVNIAIEFYSIILLLTFGGLYDANLSSMQWYKKAVCGLEPLLFLWRFPVLVNIYELRHRFPSLTPHASSSILACDMRPDLSHLAPSESHIQFVFQGYLLHIVVWAFVCNIILANLFLCCVRQGTLEHKRNRLRQFKQVDRIDNSIPNNHNNHNIHNNRINGASILGGEPLIQIVLRPLQSIMAWIIFSSLIYVCTLFFGATIPYIHSDILGLGSQASAGDSGITKSSAMIWREDILNGFLFSSFLALVSLVPIFNNYLYTYGNTTPSMEEKHVIDNPSPSLFHGICHTIFGLPFLSKLHTLGLVIIFCSWFACILIPLDWEQWFQHFPISTTFGVILGFIIGNGWVLQTALVTTTTESTEKEKVE